jgi:hypothetical protein
VISNEAPKSTKTIDDLTIELNENLDYPFPPSLFLDEDGDVLTYSI